MEPSPFDIILPQLGQKSVLSEKEYPHPTQVLVLAPEITGTLCAAETLFPRRSLHSTIIFQFVSIHSDIEIISALIRSPVRYIFPEFVVKIKLAVFIPAARGPEGKIAFTEAISTLGRNAPLPCILSQR